MPQRRFAKIRRFLAICDEIGSPNLGVHFDTSRARACRELVDIPKGDRA